MALDITTPELQPTRTGFILSEEESLKRYLAGAINIPSRKGPDREVPVSFRFTDSSRAITFPYILLDLIDVTPAYALWQSQINVLDDPAVFEDPVAGTSTVGMYYPSTTPDAIPGGRPGAYIGNYQPYHLIFQISTFANTSLDDKYMHSFMFVNVLSPRSFWIPGVADQVMRRCELLSWATADYTETIESTKRVFRKVYTISMLTEIPTTRIPEYREALVERLHVDIYDMTTQSPLPPDHDTDSPDHSKIADSFTYPPLEP